MYVLIEMNEYAYPKAVTVWNSWEDAVHAARSLIRSRGQTETFLDENSDWVSPSNHTSHIATRGTETPDSYLILRAD